MTQIAEALDRCRDITRRKAANFYWGIRLTPQPARSSMYAVYAWMRHADDLCDEADPGDPGRAGEIERFRAATAAALAGDPWDAPPGGWLWQALARVAALHPVREADFQEMLDTQLEDLRPRSLRDWEELRRYCHGVASTVGRVSIAVWGCTDPRGAALADERGYALQLTNILRDFVEDLGRGRVYLPREELEAAGLDARALRAWEAADACEAFVRGQVSRARGFYASSEPLDRMVDPACRPAMRALTEVYRQILARIAERPRRIVTERVRLGGLRKARIALAALRQCREGKS